MIFCWGCGGWWIEYHIPRCECVEWYDDEYQGWWIHPPPGWRIPAFTEQEREAYLKSILSMPKKWRPMQTVIVQGDLL